jgi:HEAT repeat protein
MESLKDSDKEVVQAVTTALGNLGGDAVPALVKLLESPDHVLRARAAAALGKTGPAGQDALPALVKALQDQQAEVRREAARAIGRIVESPIPYVPDSKN